jgi:hypothetical protein
LENLDYHGVSTIKVLSDDDSSCEDSEHVSDACAPPFDDHGWLVVQIKAKVGASIL